MERQAVNIAQERRYVVASNASINLIVNCNLKSDTPLVFEILPCLVVSFLIQKLLFLP